MKKIGLIGGLGPEATIDYYRGIIDFFKQERQDLYYPNIIIYSVNMSEFINLMNSNQWDSVVELLLSKVKALKEAGADFAALTANTPHIIFDKLAKKSPLPLLSIVEATCNEAKKHGFKRPGLLGTGFTMNGTFYQEVFEKQGMEVIMPPEVVREWINYKLFTEIELGVFLNETRKQLVEIIDQMVNEQNIDSIILGCTEFPLILTEKTYSGISVLNTTMIHVKNIVETAKED